MVDIQIPVDLGFTEFVTSLLSEVVSSIVIAQSDQEQRLAELSAAAAMDLEEFAAAHVTTDDVEAWLAEQFPSTDPDRPHDAVLDAPYTPASDDAGEAPPFEAVLGVELIRRDLRGDPPTLGQAGVRKIQEAARTELAASELLVARQLAERGIPRVIVDAGRISAKLTFEALQYRDENDVVEDIDETDDGGTQDEAEDATRGSGPIPVPQSGVFSRLDRPLLRQDVLMAGRLPGLHRSAVVPQVLRDVRLRVHTADDRKADGGSARANVYGEVELTFKTVR